MHTCRNEGLHNAFTKHSTYVHIQYIQCMYNCKCIYVLHSRKIILQVLYYEIILQFKHFFNIKLSYEQAWACIASKLPLQRKAKKASRLRMDESSRKFVSQLECTYWLKVTIFTKLFWPGQCPISMINVSSESSEHQVSNGHNFIIK